MSDAFGHSVEKKGMRITWRGIVLVVIGFLLALFCRSKPKHGSSELIWYGL